MSLVTNCVFIAESRDDASEFKRIIRENGVYSDPEAEPDIVKSRGPKCAGDYVFYLGIKNASSELFEALVAQEWRYTCVLWWYPEYMNFPVVHSWNVKEPTGTSRDYA